MAWWGWLARPCLLVAWRGGVSPAECWCNASQSTGIFTVLLAAVSVGLILRRETVHMSQDLCFCALAEHLALSACLAACSAGKSGKQLHLLFT